ncbi:dihydroorotase [Fructilactobacillus lindneri DSM 20690 = JCM 11027]|uniref:Dihydroorotase n=1 Tax=Fructilactobacillus lindneri DSM 20690 = JCM 11027 TaxID=1122148 RepID=A0A0R2JQ25_9LACO|nr:dihydroorotase [Fructilactobacillus lindneri]KRN79231.1 dihydroorotase [Fructilactobacillus lindneri DSM 20690 = JCM 11027]SJZ71879.1 dihydroorotase [Fructilactobacillus lindneri DSM 20690 = JCM 11027]
MHVHFRDPGQTAKETVKTGSEASAHGGYTTVCAMPNVTPVPNTPDKLKEMAAYNEKQGVINVEQYSPVTYDERGNHLVDFAAMKRAGAVAFSNDGIGIQTGKTMFDAMVEIAKTGLPLAAHVEDHALMNGGVMNEGRVSEALGLKGANEVAETSQLARDLELARVTHVHYHVCHVSKSRSVELIRRAKADGVNVTAEVSPHHLLLDDSMIKMDNPMYKMNPPLRSKEDCEALLTGLLDGTIDMIATDHAPHTITDKGDSFVDSAFGITGIETAFPLLYTSLVETKKVTLQQLLKWMSRAPVEKFNLTNDNELKVGNLANFAIWDLQHQHKIITTEMKSKGRNSPFIGEQVNANNLATFSNGKLVYQA